MTRSCAAKAIARGDRCDSPHVLQRAYGVEALLAHGINGRGETVVPPEAAYPASQSLPAHVGVYLRQSVAAYDKRFGPPPAHLRLDTTLSPGSSANSVVGAEEVLDVEMVHAMAPGATIDVELLNALVGLKNLSAVVRHAAKVGQVLSMSFGTGERCLNPAACDPAGTCQRAGQGAVRVRLGG